MKKTQTLLIVLCTLCVGLFLRFFVDGYGLKYSISDCVTYFDKDGQYQLLYVGNNYYLYDAKTTESICPTIRHYQHKDNNIYLIYDVYIGGDAQNPIYEKYYGIFNIKTGTLVSAKTSNELPESFVMEKDMIELPHKKSNFERWISDFIPHKYRKK